jgi:hypothetical protein
MIEGAGAYANEYFIVAEDWLGDIGIPKNGRVAVFVDDDGFHNQSPAARG